MFNHYLDKDKEIMRSTERSYHKKIGNFLRKEGITEDQRNKGNSFLVKSLQKLNLIQNFHLFKKKTKEN